jgi:CheY-like chemotaxis protein
MRTLTQEPTLADRMAPLQTLAAGAAHEINNPLASLVATLDFLREELRAPPSGRTAEFEQALAEASEAAQRIARIVCDLKVFGGEVGPEAKARSAPPLIGPAEDRRPRLGPSPSRAKVLIVDDDPAVGSALKRALRFSNVTVVRSGPRAVEAVSEADPPFDVILCDLMMPEMSGMDVYELLSKTQPAAAERMVFVTGGAVTARVREFLETVHRPSMLKPFDSEALRALVEHVARQPSQAAERG